MKTPLLVCALDTLIILPDFFARIGELRLNEQVLDVNVTRTGTAGMHWIVDADGTFFELRSVGLKRTTLWQKLGLLRCKERYSIAAGRPITVGELQDRIADLRNQFEEAPNVSDLRRMLSTYSRSSIIGPTQMSQYFNVPEGLQYRT
jgi:hypothetical protein